MATTARYIDVIDVKLSKAVETIFCKSIYSFNFLSIAELELEYRREIDGLRAVAVIPVILFHAGFESFSGGFVGVDVFFVISGYLITTIILSEKQKGTFSLLNFYERRARRILPALFFLMLVTIPFAWFVLQPQDLQDFSQSLIAVSLFGSNILFWKEADYFATASELKPLLHTWSLAVEEQYYVLFPIFLTIVWKYRKRWVFSSIVLLGLFSLIIAQWGAFYKPVAAFFLLPTRAWELMVGGASAFLLLYGASNNTIVAKYKAISEFLGVLGLLLIFYSIFIFDKSTPFPSLYALVPTLGVALIIIFANNETIVGKVLGGKFLVNVGLISYSAYLWHHPIFVFPRHYSNYYVSIWLISLLIIATYFFAYLSWRYVEKPFRNKEKISRSKIFQFSLIGSVFFILTGVVGDLTSGFEEYYYSQRFTPSQLTNYKIIKKNTNYNLYDVMSDNGNCVFWNRTIDYEVTERFQNCYEKYGKGVIVLGDSHAMNLFNIVAKSKQYDFVLGVSQGGCRPQDNKPICHYDAFDDFVSKNTSKIKLVIYHQSGSYYVMDKNGAVDSSLVFKDKERYSFNEGFVKSTIDYIHKLKKLGVNVLWVGPFTEARIDFNSKKLLNGNFELNENSIQIFKKLENYLIEQVNKSPKLTPNEYLSFNKIIQIDKTFLFIEGCLTYRDIDHFSQCGENIISNKIKPILNSIF